MKWWIAAIVAVSVTAAAGAWKIKERMAWQEEIATAQHQIVKAAETFPKRQAVIFGDSNTSQTWFPEHCGLRVLNAGVSGTGLPHDTEFVDRVIQASDPSRVIIAWGVNNADDPGFIDRYRALVRRIRRPVVIVGIWPAQTRSREFIHTANAGLKMIAELEGAVFIEPPQNARTADGLHLAPEEKMQRAQRVAGACQAISRGSSPATSTARP